MTNLTVHPASGLVGISCSDGIFRIFDLRVQKYARRPVVRSPFSCITLCRPLISATLGHEGYVFTPAFSSVVGLTYQHCELGGVCGE
jgi:hypothetical protein